MKLKLKTGMGVAKKKVKSSFASIVKKAKVAIKHIQPKTLKSAIQVARKAIGKVKSSNYKLPRVISVQGGVLPLVPIFAALGALGSLSGGAAAIAKTVKDVQAAKKSLEESKRHNRAIEETLKIGSGFFLKPYRQGYGLFLKPYPKNF